MRSSHLTAMAFCHVLLVSIVFYSTSPALALPLDQQRVAEVKPVRPVEAKSQLIVHPPAVAIAAPKAPVESIPKIKSSAPAPQTVMPAPENVQIAAQKDHTHQAVKAAIIDEKPILSERKAEFKDSKPEIEKPIAINKPAEPKGRSEIKSQVESKVENTKPDYIETPKRIESPPAPIEIIEKSDKRVETLMVQLAQNQNVIEKVQPAAGPQAAALVASIQEKAQIREDPQQQAPSLIVVKEESVKPVESSPIVPARAPTAAEQQSVAKTAAPSPLVKGGLGPLHLLATTLCSYQPDKAVADETLNQLYARRASVRKTLFDFMSLKFTNLEKLSSRLGLGLQVVPVKTQLDNKSPGVTPSHGWPVVGKCTAYDLKLMGEAAWCECQEGDLGCASKSEDTKPASAASLEEQPPRVTSNKHVLSKTARSISSSTSFLPSPEESSVISKLLHVSDVKDAPTVDSTIYSLNLTQSQLATLEAHATSTLECRRNALRYTKALFNHLAEDQNEVSESWPRLYALISSDDCARKRMIDIVNALSGFRTDTTSIRRDNLEFAFAMDDLRGKVLENEVNVQLTFDRHFIEVEQFLQQSVRLMLANIQPKRAKLTSMRYRSLMYGASPQAADDQCIDLHQRLLARSYPSDCNPTQFGQLPDVLRMTASSLELWSIEKELSLHKASDYPYTNAAGQQKVKEDVNECIANLVSS